MGMAGGEHMSDEMLVMYSNILYGHIVCVSFTENEILSPYIPHTPFRVIDKHVCNSSTMFASLSVL